MIYPASNTGRFGPRLLAQRAHKAHKAWNERLAGGKALARNRCSSPLG
jgi:hypothetical protein